MNSQYPESLITVKETAKLLRISESGVRRLLSKKLIPVYKVMGSLRIDRDDVYIFLKSQCRIVTGRNEDSEANNYDNQ